MLSQPALGRFWRPEEDTQHLAVVSHDYWQSGFGSRRRHRQDDQSLQQTIHDRRRGAAEFNIPAVSSKSGTRWARRWPAPAQMENRQFRIFRAVAHLKPGVSAAQMQSEMDVISERLQRQYPD